MADTHIDTIKAATVAFVTKQLEIEDALAANSSPEVKAEKKRELTAARREWKNAVALARAKLHGRSK